MAVKQFYAEETIYYTDDLDGSFGDKVLATANAVASGGGGASGMLLTISQSGDDFVLDKNYTEIKTALESGIFPFALMLGDGGLNLPYVIIDYGYSQSKYVVELYSFRGGIQGVVTFLSDTDDGVLVMYQGD